MMTRTLVQVAKVLAVVTIVLACAMSAPANEMVVVDLNTATVDQLTTLKYVGDKLAARIIAYRSEVGPFSAVEDLLAVKGIGKRILEVNRERITVSGAKASISE